MNPYLTIGLPVYNCQNTLSKSIDAVLNQSWNGEYELLIVNDGSTDATMEIAKKYCILDSRIRIISHKSNLGRAHARNTVLKNAKGEYLAWIDDNDAWDSEKLLLQFSRLELEKDIESVICITPHNVLIGEKERLHLFTPNLNGDHLRNVLDGSLPCYLWTFLSKRSVYERVGPFDIRLNRFQDLDMLIRILTSGCNVVMTDPSRPLCTYYKSYKGVFSSEISNAFQIIWHKHEKLFNHYGSKFAKECKSTFFFMASQYARSNKEWNRYMYWLLYATYCSSRLTFEYLNNKKYLNF